MKNNQFQRDVSKMNFGEKKPGDDLGNDSSPERKAEVFLFLCFCISFLVICFFHEPWYDEALAWQIARTGSLKNILFSVPHYEGHPPFWYLLLAVPARIGVPYEIGLKTVSGIATIISVWLILFRAPFPKPVRMLLPFHYFIFYQYGVIARPYSYLLLIFLLLAMSYHQKEEKPGRFVLLLACLCMCSGYGIVLAGGIAAVWLYDICCSVHWKVFSKELMKDKRIHSLAVLLVFAGILILGILPGEDAYAVSRSGGNSLISRLLYTFFLMLPDSTLMTTLQGAEFLKYHIMSFSGLAIGIFAGGLMLAAIVLAANRNTIKYYAVPYTLFAVFAAAVYFCAHHIGIVLCFTVFWFWICLEEKDSFAYAKAAGQKLQKALSGRLAEKDVKLLKTFGVFLGYLLLFIPIYWTVSASVREIAEPYYYAKSAAKFIREHQLQEQTAFAGWDYGEDTEDEETDFYDNMDTNLVSIPAAILPYFDTNFVLNYADGAMENAYVSHRVASAEENRENLQKWAEYDCPAFLLGNVNLQMIYGKEAVLPKYVPVYKLEPYYANIWKNYSSNANIMSDFYIYLREDLTEQYGLQSIR